MPAPPTIETAPSAYGYPLLIKQLLVSPLIHSADQEIVYRDLRRYTYRTFRDRVGQLANVLAALGVRPGDKVGVMDWDSYRYLESYFAVPMMGAVLHTVNIRLSPEQVLYTVNHLQDDVLLVHQDFLPLVAALRERMPTVKRYILLTDNNTAVPDFFAGEYEGLMSAASADYAFPDFDENTTATAFYTTGTTGVPKGVAFSHRHLVLHTLGVAAMMNSSPAGPRFSSGDVYMPLTPMFHVHAWGCPYVATMLGVKQVYPGMYAPTMLCDLLRREKVTTTHCVPTILQMLLTHPASQGMRFDGLKMTIGGAALPKGLAKAALDRGIDVVSGYGLSETCPLLTIARLPADVLSRTLDEQLDLRTSTGVPGPMVDLHIVDETMHEVPHDGIATGEIVVRAPWLTQCYLRDGEASGRLWNGGYLHTGDVAHLTPGGSLHITDRVKDVIKSGGEWISSLEIEDIISQVKGVSEVAVIGTKDERWSERPLAMVVLKTEYIGQVTVDEIRTHVEAEVGRGVISKWAVPDKIFFVDAIPKTSVGKIDKKVIRKQYQA